MKTPLTIEFLIANGFKQEPAPEGCALYFERPTPSGATLILEQLDPDQDSRWEGSLCEHGSCVSFVNDNIGTTEGVSGLLYALGIEPKSP